MCPPPSSPRGAGQADWLSPQLPEGPDPHTQSPADGKAGQGEAPRQMPGLRESGLPEESLPRGLGEGLLRASGSICVTTASLHPGS